MYDVIVVGAGPAGLFASYELAKKNKNLKILLIDKGKFAKKRGCPIAENKKECINCKPCQILSGYGGAGTFSDGKLNSLIRDKDTVGRFVLETFVKFGAPKEILYKNKVYDFSLSERNI